MNHLPNDFENCGAVTENLHLVGNHVAGRDIHITIHQPGRSLWRNFFRLSTDWLAGKWGWRVIAALVLLSGVLSWMAIFDFTQVPESWLALLPLFAVLLLSPSAKKSLLWVVVLAVGCALGLLFFHPVSGIVFVDRPADEKTEHPSLSATQEGGPTRGQVADLVTDRISAWQDKIDRTWQQDGNRVSCHDTLRHYYDRCSSLLNGASPNYRFSNDYVTLRSPRNLKRLGFDLSFFEWLDESEMTPVGYYQSAPTQNLGAPDRELTFMAHFTREVEFDVTRSQRNGEAWDVEVVYSDPIRLIAWRMRMPDNRIDGEVKEVRILGFKPRETFRLKQQNGNWVFDEVI